MVLTVLLILLFVPLSFAQSATGSIGLNVITGGAVETTIEEQNLAVESNTTTDEIKTRKYGRGLAAVTGESISDDTEAGCLKIILPIFAILIIIVLVGHIFYTRKKKKQQ